MSTVRQTLLPLPIPSSARRCCAAEDCSGMCDPTPAPRRGNLLQRMVLAARRAGIRFEISALEQHLVEAERDGIVVSDTIVDWTYALQDKRAQLREMETAGV